MSQFKNHFILRHQPLKAIYLTYVAGSLLFVRLPYWFLTSLVPRFRPRRSWTIRRTLLLKCVQVIAPAIFNVGAFDYVRVDPRRFVGKEDKVGLVWIDPAPEVIVGEIAAFAKANQVSPAQVPAYWFGARDPVTYLAGQHASPDEKIILALHSGGSVMGDASPFGTSSILIQDMLARFPQFSRILNVEYRLSQGPPWPYENPFPAALIDAITAYHYLVNTLHFDPSNILVMGDSAGGTLALQLVRYILAVNLRELPIPGGLLLLSPSMDWGNTHETPGASAYENSSTDWVHAFGAGYTSRALLGHLSPSDPKLKAWQAPSSNMLPEGSSGEGFPQTLFVAGDAEMTFDAIKAASERVAEDVGWDKVDFVRLPDATHICLNFPWHEEEKEQTYRVVGSWLDAHF